jgi:hypothetical protein
MQCRESRRSCLERIRWQGRGAVLRREVGLYIRGSEGKLTWVMNLLAGVIELGTLKGAYLNVIVRCRQRARDERLRKSVHCDWRASDVWAE